jgi:hypothetical protein
LRSLLMTHLALLEKTPPSNGTHAQPKQETHELVESKEEEFPPTSLADTNRITVY